MGIPCFLKVSFDFVSQAVLGQLGPLTCGSGFVYLPSVIPKCLKINKDPGIHVLVTFAFLNNVFSFIISE